MQTTVKRLYEAMFLVDSARATDWDGTIAAIKTILDRAGAEVAGLRKWDERRLAYEINGKARGTYILCYFKADGNRIQDIEKMVQLSEGIMRLLILSAEGRAEADIERDLAEPGSRAAAEKEAATAQTEEPKPRAAEEATEETEAIEAPAEGEKAEAEEPEESAEPAAAEPEQPEDEDLELSDEQAKKETAED